jgi:hypothetical protein
MKHVILMRVVTFGASKGAGVIRRVIRVRMFSVINFLPPPSSDRIYEFSR